LSNLGKATFSEACWNPGEKEGFSIPAQLKLLSNYASGQAVPPPIPEESRRNSSVND
jgi:hypothetical protein